MSIIITLSYVLILVYAIVLIVYLIGFLRSDERGAIDHEQRTFFSIVIAARNEEKTIIDCLNSILNQAYPISKYEILISDDASSDQTVLLVKEFIKNNAFCSIQLIESNGVHEGKKKSLKRAVDKSKGDYLLFTDADCTAGMNWLNEMDSILSKRPYEMVAGPVLYKGSGIISNILNVEMAALQAISVSSVKMRKPLMCNGANICLQRNVWLAHYDAMMKEPYPGGDDVFMMLSVMDKNYKNFYYSRSYNAMVYTQPAKSIIEFSDQRNRWASKIYHLRRMYISSLGLLVLLSNLVVCVFMVSSVFNKDILSVSLNLLLLKAGSDILISTSALNNFKRSDLIVYSFPAFALNLFYVPLIALRSALFSYKWKGKSYSN